MDGTITVLDKNQLIESYSEKSDDRGFGLSQIIALLVFIAIGIFIIFILKLDIMKTK